MSFSLRPRVVDLYLSRCVLVATLGAWAVLVGFDVILALVNELDEIGEGGYTLSHAVLYSAYTVPRRIYELFPTAALIGCVLGLGGLAARSELTAMRAVGMSRLRIGLGALLALAGVTALMVVNAETAAPYGEQSAQSVASAAKTGDVVMARVSGLWAREGNVFLNARDGVRRQVDGQEWTELQGVRLFEFDAEGKLLSLAEARTAEHRGDGWVLRDVTRSTFGERSAQSQTLAEERWETGLDDQALAAAASRPRYLSSAELSRNISYMQRNGLDPKAFENAYWARWFYPVNVAVLCLAALPFAFGSLRSGGFGKRLFIAIVIGVAYLLVQRLVVSLSDVYRFDARLAYLIPPVALMGLCWGVFARRD
ncbi:LPS export ABC transporter permease LptG [Arenimonas terrae]|jgi:lipopolysaccharide export system permease protein|uniref:LPS export ABC transporter permease LptG n=1 Tax=Arenimonas terrae TaxID=2546226 RepID=A0A5C4RWY0_9GAMM|nr:LPS export ABC transporter permease LptG [Arenimonas terrae]TNJ35564.1 LPS export ABC transporter permease LptG [Arenimonas terrae]